MKETPFTATLTPVIEVATVRSLAHPFIVGLSDGTLPLATFRYYLRQDHQYLEMFGLLHEVLAAQLNTALAQILTSLGEGEDLARQRLHAELKLSAVELAATKPAPTNYAYLTHMAYQNQAHGKAALAAGLLPCYWLYNEVGRRLAQKHSPNPLYQEFFDSYASDDFSSSTNQMRAIVDKLAAPLDEAAHEQMRQAFVKSCYYEEQFWQMAYEQQRWH